MKKLRISMFLLLVATSSHAGSEISYSPLPPALPGMSGQTSDGNDVREAMVPADAHDIKIAEARWTPSNKIELIVSYQSKHPVIPSEASPSEDMSEGFLKFAFNGDALPEEVKEELMSAPSLTSVAGEYFNLNVQNRVTVGSTVGPDHSGICTPADQGTPRCELEITDSTQCLQAKLVSVELKK